MATQYPIPARGRFLSFVLAFFGLFVAVDAVVALGLATLSVALGTRFSPTVLLALFLCLPLLFIAGVLLMRWSWPDEEGTR